MMGVEWLGFALLYILSVTGTISVPPWMLIVAYMVARFVFGVGGSEKVKDQEGGEDGAEGCPSYGYCMVQGRREYMEDYTFASVEVGPDGKHERSFFGVFDGHSGKKAAIHAKERLFSLLSSLLDQGMSPPEALKQAFVIADEEFLRRAKREGLGDGSTVTTALVIGREVWAANAGDSRTILCRGVDGPLALSEDHKPDRPSERKRIVALGGQVIFIGCARVNGMLATSRGFGDKDLKPLVSAEPEITHHELEEGDEFVLLASDGLWDVMSNAEAACILSCAAKEKAAPQNCKDASQTLVRAALRMGSMDNVSAMVVDVRPVIKGGGAVSKKGGGEKGGMKKVALERNGNSWKEGVEEERGHGDGDGDDDDDDDDWQDKDGEYVSLDELAVGAEDSSTVSSG